MVVYVQADKEKMEAEQRAAAELARRQAAEAADALRAKEAAIMAREDEMRKVFFSSNCVLILIFSWQLLMSFLILKKVNVLPRSCTNFQKTLGMRACAWQRHTPCSIYSAFEV